MTPADCGTDVPASGERVADGSCASTVLDLLGDEYARVIFLATAEEPLSAKELSEVCDVDVSTVYRRVDEMLEAGLLEEKTRLVPDGSHHSVYAAATDRIVVGVEEGSFTVDVADGDESASGRFTRMWEDMRES